jgi:hypothetical protein
MLCGRISRKGALFFMLFFERKDGWLFLNVYPSTGVLVLQRIINNSERMGIEIRFSLRSFSFLRGYVEVVKYVIRAVKL